MAIDSRTTLSISLALGIPAVMVGGPCPGDVHLVVVRSPTGDGCADPAAVRDLHDAVTALARPQRDIVEPRPVPIDAPIEISMPGVFISLAKRPTVMIANAEHPADPDRVAELVRALAEPATIIDNPPGS